MLRYSAVSSGEALVTQIDIQPVTARLSRHAIFIVASVKPGEAHLSLVRSFCGELAGLIRAVGFRDLDSSLSCIMGIGPRIWDELFKGHRPKELRPFPQLSGAHDAPSTPGDLLFHIRASRIDMCFELAMHITSKLGPALVIEDETHGFKYFDDRDLLGFVDGTENPVGFALNEAVLVGDEDPAFAGGSYVIVQKYLHDLPKWNAIPVENQEGIVGRKKLSDIELDDADKPPFAHNVLTTIEEDGRQLEILRDNMPFGNIKDGEFGTYFIGYARSPARIERMLRNMFIGDPPGNYDRLLDVSKAVTGTSFFVPSATLLADLGEP